MDYPPNKNYGVVLNGESVGNVEVTGDLEQDKATIMAYIKQKGLYVQPDEIKTMFRQALSFSTTAAYLFERDLKRSPWNVYSVAPFVVNSAFNIELYLKILAKIYKNPMKGHDLLALFDALPSNAHKAIDAVLPRCLPRFQPAGNVDLRTCISELANAFVEWRYLHEKQSTSTLHIDRMIFVMKVLDEACRSESAVNSPDVKKAPTAEG